MSSYVKGRTAAGATAVVKDGMERGWSKLWCNSWRSTTAGREGQRTREREYIYRCGRRAQLVAREDFSGDVETTQSWVATGGSRE